MNNIPTKFYNLISKTEFNNYSLQEQGSFLVKNKIYTKLDVDFSEEELKERIKVFGSKFNACHSMNMEVHYEIIRSYLIDNLIHWDNSEMINKIILKTSNSIDAQDRKLILEKFHKKYLNKLSKIEFSEQYFINKNKNLDPFDFYFKDKVIYSITDGFLMNYIFDSKTFYEDEDVFKQWSKVAKIDKTLEFIKKELNELSETGQKTEDQILKLDIADDVFKPNSKALFYGILEKYKALDKNHHSINNIFKPICQSIWESDFKYKILQNDLSKTFFCTFLNDTFNSNINVKNTKISTSIKFDSKVDKILEEYKQM